MPPLRSTSQAAAARSAAAPAEDVAATAADARFGRQVGWRIHQLDASPSGDPAPPLAGAVQRATEDELLRLRAACSDPAAQVDPASSSDNGDSGGHPPRDCRLLITGCGRAGTHYVAQQLLGNGVQAPHESLGAEGAVSWMYAPLAAGRRVGPIPYESAADRAARRHIEWYAATRPGRPLSPPTAWHDL